MVRHLARLRVHPLGAAVVSGADRIVLSVTTPGSNPQVVVLGLPAIAGRGPECTLLLSDPAASARHARIEHASAGVVWTDLGSSNGTWVGGAAASHVNLRPGSALRVGASEVRCLAIGVAHSEVVVVRAPGRAGNRVVRFPTAVHLNDDGELRFGTAPASAPERALCQFVDDRVQLVRILDDGALQPPVVPDGDGLLAFGGAHIGSRGARLPTVVGTDLTFNGAGAVVRAQSASSPTPGFPPAWFEAPRLDPERIAACRVPVIEVPFLALGGGLGSFCWVDALRVHGTPTADIAVVGFEPVPYARYQRLCRHSQIPDHERLRSNSESCPDNLWGFPGYGLREFVEAVRAGSLGSAARVAWQLTTEPDLAATYTPRARDVFAAIDLESERIGWNHMYHRGRIRRVRQTTDGRYAVAVSSRSDPAGPDAIYMAPVVHLALGYPGLRFLDDLREYRETSGDFHRVVNAYEDHDHVYADLATRGGTVVLRGRGIVASRVLQRLSEVRAAGARVRVVHLMRSPRVEGAQVGSAVRRVENHWEFQPFNWPEACWGGDLREVLERAPLDERQELLSTWGGTTTADRSDWKRIVRRGLRAGWYTISFGRAKSMTQGAADLEVEVDGADGEYALTADFVIDATGLVSSLHANPVLADLVETYALPLNAQGRLELTDDFELGELAHGAGRFFAAGVCALGGGYAPVDSFLGLQYAASRSIGELGSRVPPLTPPRSVAAWWRWMRGAAP
ncbi:MAG: pSer/pThr/pTyr-binding forkhead associated (FHA) protein [Myxococcota bacterium]|jgi:pSer/pThr/pTyr-binding forkhead associated (FHA) protein